MALVNRAWQTISGKFGKKSGIVTGKLIYCLHLPSEGTEAALARANFLSTTKLETLQAFVMYMVCN